MRYLGILLAIVFITSFASAYSLGNGSDGNFSCTSGTTNLSLDRIYNYQNFVVGTGCTISTNSTSGAVLYILATGDANISGLINLSNVMPAGNNVTNYTAVNDGVSTTFFNPGVAGPNSGFGDGGNGGVAQGIAGGYGGSGGTPAGTGGANATCSSASTMVGKNGSASSGGSGACYSASGGGQKESGNGGNAYGGVGGTGNGFNYGCMGGGGGAGGSAGKPGVNVFIQANSIMYNGTVDLRGIGGGNGGIGGGGLVTQAADGYYAYGGDGGDGGSGGNSGNLTLNYVSSYSNTGSTYTTAGAAGTFGAGSSGQVYNGTLQGGYFGTNGSNGATGAAGATFVSYIAGANDSAYGDGTDGNLVFTTSTKSYGSLLNNTDYNASGDTLYLNLNRAYQFVNITVGTGTTISSQNTSGAVLYLLAQDTAILNGTFNVSNVVAAGNRSDAFAFKGDTISSPGVAGTGSGFGAGGQGGNANNSGAIIVGSAGGAGGSPNGTGGSGATYTNNGGCGGSTSSTAGGNSAGGGGAAYQASCSCTGAVNGGNGNGAYGGNGANGAFTGDCSATTRVAAGGGGAGGNSGKAGVHVVIKAHYIVTNATYFTSGTSGANGGNGGNGAGGGAAYGAQGGAGGSGGSGGNGGNVSFTYWTLSDLSTKTMGAGLAGAAGTAGTLSGAINSSANGTAGTAGTNGSFVTNQSISMPANATVIITLGTYRNDSFVASCNTTDPQGFALTYYYQFNSTLGNPLQAYSTNATYATCSSNLTCNKTNGIRVGCKAYNGVLYSNESFVNGAISNTPPTTPTTPSIATPAGTAYRTDTFTSSVAAGSTDPDPEDSIAYTYQFVSGSGIGTVLQAYGASNSYAGCSGNTACNKTKGISVVVRASDGTAANTSSTSATKAISNTAPSTPSTPTFTTGNYKPDTFTLSIGTGSTDPDPEDTLGYYYQFENLAGTAILRPYGISAAYTTCSANATCNKTGDIRGIVNVTDGTAFNLSAYVNKDILNSPPSAPSAPTFASGTYRGDTFTLNTCTATDGDGDSLTYNYRFENAAGTAIFQAYSTNVSYSLCSTNALCNKTGDMRAICNVTDGTATNASAYSATKDILNTAPTVPSADTLTPASPLIQQNLTMGCSGSTDIDPGDSISYYLRPYDINDSAYRSTFSTSTQYNLTAPTDSHDSFRADCYAFDGTDTSTTRTGTTIRAVANSAPYIVAPTITPIPAYKTNNLTCNPGACTDIDGDACTSAYLWYNQTGTTGQTSQNLSNGNFSKNYNMTCQQTPTDNYSLSGTPKNSSVLTISNTAPTINVSMSFVNSTTLHQFNATAGIYDPDGASDITSTNASATLGNCTIIKNTTSTNFYNATASCNTTVLGAATVTIGFTDASGSYVQTNGSNSYQNHAPTTSISSVSNSTTGHWFSYNTTITDLDGLLDQSYLLSSTLGTCTATSNTTNTTSITLAMNCSSTHEGTATIKTNSTDAVGANNYSTSTNSYPAFPTLTSPNVTPSAPGVGSAVNCTNGTFSDTDAIENATNRTWAWYVNGTLANITTQVFVPSSYNYTKGMNLSCKETTSGSNWTSYQVSNSSLNVTINNTAPAASAPTSIATSATYIEINCTASDADGWADISSFNATVTNGSVAAISNGTGWAAWNVTGLFSNESINMTCTVNDSSEAIGTATSSFTTTDGDSYGTETQLGYAVANGTVTWMQSYTTVGGAHTCTYIPAKTDYTNSPIPTVSDVNSTAGNTTSTPANFSWSCIGALSPYSLTFRSYPVIMNSTNLSSSVLGNNPMQYRLSPNTTLNVVLEFNFTFPQSSSARKLWKCVLNNFTTCDANDSGLWSSISFSEIDTGAGINASKIITVSSSELVYATTNDGAGGSVVPGGGGGGGGITVVENITTTTPYVPGKVTTKIPILSDIDNFFSYKTSTGYSFGILNYWLFSVIYALYFIASLMHAGNPKNASGSTYLGGADVLIFIVWMLGLINYWPGVII